MFKMISVTGYYTLNINPQHDTFISGFALKQQCGMTALWLCYKNNTLRIFQVYCIPRHFIMPF